ncbi:type II secretion system protein J [Phycisphaerales bacterium AB-hyl4]|uniref:Type II secretion system protein J n=1 Tax=Natronomicrosphaera hydrolytica TaxID=3242702 RepID=A0ABV4U585_9BACT
MIANRHRGMTLIELILAVAITAVVGMAVVAMLSAVDYGTNSSRDLRELVVRSKTLTERINDLVHQADEVLAVGEDYIVLWVRDVENLDGDTVYRHELRHLAHDSNTNELHLYIAADTSPNTTYDATADFSNLLATEQSRRLARGVASWQVELDPAEPADARLVTYRLALTVGGLQESIISSAALRNR